MKKMTESAVMLDWEISEYVDILQGELHRDVRCHLTYSRCLVHINDLIVAVEASRQGVTVGEGTVSGLMFADDFVGISETPEGLQKHT